MDPNIRRSGALGFILFKGAASAEKLSCVLHQGPLGTGFNLWEQHDHDQFV